MTNTNDDGAKIRSRGEEALPPFMRGKMRAVGNLTKMVMSLLPIDRDERAGSSAFKLQQWDSSVPNPDQAPAECSRSA